FAEIDFALLTLVANIAAFHPWRPFANGLRWIVLFWAGSMAFYWYTGGANIDWMVFIPIVVMTVFPFLGQLPKPWGGTTYVLAGVGFMLWFATQIQHVTGLIGLASLFMIIF
ncbi:MAG: hypothetical protein AAF639_46055, partial [Chloroflexota bacterium]